MNDSCLNIKRTEQKCTWKVGRKTLKNSEYITAHHLHGSLVETL